VEREVRVADSEDPWVQAMQTSSIDGSIDSASGVTEWPRQLTYRDDPMLPLRKIGKLPMLAGRVLRPFAPHSGANGRSASISPPTQSVVRAASALQAQESRRPWGRRLWRRL